MNEIQKILCERLDGKIKMRIERHTNAMMRSIQYASDKKTKYWKATKKLGWDFQSLELLCSIISFFQHVISPLSTVANSETKVGLGQSIPLMYGGKIKIDDTNNENIKKTIEAFDKTCVQLRIDRYWLCARHGDDLLYLIGRGYWNDN